MSRFSIRAGRHLVDIVVLAVAFAYAALQNPGGGCSGCGGEHASAATEGGRGGTNGAEAATAGAAASP